MYCEVTTKQDFNCHLFSLFVHELNGIELGNLKSSTINSSYNTFSAFVWNNNWNEKYSLCQSDGDVCFACKPRNATETKKLYLPSA